MKIGVGCVVVVRFSDNFTKEFRLTGSPQEVNPACGIISCFSPLGSALMGKGAGEQVSYVVDSRRARAEVVAVKEPQ